MYVVDIVGFGCYFPFLCLELFLPETELWIFLLLVSPLCVYWASDFVCAGMGEFNKFIYSSTITPIPRTKHKYDSNTEYCFHE